MLGSITLAFSYPHFTQTFVNTGSKSGDYSAVEKGKNIIVSVGKASMTLKDAVGIEIYFITENDAAET